MEFKPRSGGVFGYNEMMRKKVKTKWGINLSVERELLVSEGDVVAEGQLLAKVKERKVNSFDLSGFLGKTSQDKLAALNEKFNNSWVNTGELVCMTGGIFPSKICFPMSGKFLGIDEFGVLKIEEESEIEKKIISPVNSKVSKIEEDKIVLEFEVEEFKGEGLVGGKVWAKGEIKIINEIKSLNFDLGGGLLFTDNLSKAFLLKAEVVGVKGLVTNIKTEDDLATDLPVLFLEGNEWSELMTKNGEIKNCLLNSRAGRLLVVLE